MVNFKIFETLAVPVGACRAALGMVALSSGTELVSGSGVLLLGEVGIRLGTNRGFLCIQRNKHSQEKFA